MAANDDQDDEGETLVMTRRSLPNTAKPEPPAESGVVIAPSGAPPESVPILQRADEPKAPPSRWNRFKRAARRFGDSFAEVFFGKIPPITPYLPSVPRRRGRDQTLLSPESIATGLQIEDLFLAILYASRREQIAVLYVTNRALFIRTDGEKAYAEFIVQFALSRMPPDRGGRIALAELRGRLASMSPGELVPALIRLEDRKIVRLIQKPNCTDPMVELLREGIEYIELRVPV